MPDRQTEKTIAAYSVSKTYSGISGVQVDAVRSLDLEIAKGECCIISGPNGSGKTTLLTILGCMSRPTSGSITIMNTDVLTLSQNELTRFRMKSIGFIFQTFCLIDFLTARENVELAAHIAGSSDSEASHSASLLMEELGIIHRADFFPPQLSGGEKQRIAIARALMNGPGLILADEPTGSLDSASGQMIVRLLRTAAKERNTSVVIVSHDERIYPFADRVLRMEDGTLSERGK